MHIEISAGGLVGALSVLELQSEFNSFLSSAQDVVSGFKTVVSKTQNLNGGVGRLQSAVDDVNKRIHKEETKAQNAEGVLKQTVDFLDLAVRVDDQVATLVTKNQEEFYRTNPWLRPPQPQSDDRPWYKKAWDWLCDTGEAIGEAIKEGWNWVKDTAKKAWEGLVTFYKEHKKVIDTILIVVGAVLAIAAVIASGGGALIPILTALGVSAGTAAAISGAVAVVAVVSTVASSTLNVVDIWCEIDNPTFQAWKKGLNIVSTVSNLTYSIGSIYNSFHGITPEQTKQMMKNIMSGNRGTIYEGYQIPFASDYQPGTDSNINRDFIDYEWDRNEFYQVNNPSGGKVTVSATQVNDYGVDALPIDPTKKTFVLSGTHGNEFGGFDFGGPPDPLQFFESDTKFFGKLYPKDIVEVVNVQDLIYSYNQFGIPTSFNLPAFQKIFQSGSDIICAWCYSERNTLIQTLLGMRI